jgi:hypothetical protein
MKFKNKNKIIFRAQSEHVWEVRQKPYPASKGLPNWWKEMPPYSSHDNKLRLDPHSTVTVKKCAPTLDAISAGYIVPLWADVMISQQNGFPYAQWTTSENVFDTWHVQQVSSYEIPDGFSSTIFKYLHGWTIKTPPGWSCLITHPIAYSNLPIRAISGIVDTDNLETDINTPILIKNNFEGIIKKGTPMFQVIPIKKENWESDFVLEKPNQLYFNAEKLKTTIISSYSRTLRIPKSYK